MIQAILVLQHELRESENYISLVAIAMPKGEDDGQTASKENFLDGK